jgi:four helix bundle protein
LALKELRESNYWLRLLAESDQMPLDRLADIIDESTQLRAILSKAVATTKAKMK